MAQAAAIQNVTQTCVRPPKERLLLRPMPLWKRSLDILGSLVALAIFSPVMVLTAIAVKLTSPGPVIFKQQRAGRAGVPFPFYKFRSMCVGAEGLKSGLMGHNEQTGPVFKMKNDPRVTPVGRFIRRWSIDELPQLWNVLKGDMSLVGPRALPCEEIPCGMGLCQTPGHVCRLSVLPGLTCFWQVSGRSLVSFDRWLEMDMRYVREQSFLTDLRILFLTVPAVLSRRGAH